MKPEEEVLEFLLCNCRQDPKGGEWYAEGILHRVIQWDHPHFKGCPFRVRVGEKKYAQINKVEPHDET